MTNLKSKSVFVVCGETSGDEHMAPVLKVLKSRNSELKFFGMGGEDLEKEGMDLVIDARTSASVMGFTEVLGKIGTLYKAFWKLVAEVDKRKPDVAVLVDFPDFNLRMAEKLKARGIKVVYFISPQLWAWRQGRIVKMKKYVHKILPIFPFEEDFYKTHGVEAKYVGHPFVDRKVPVVTKEEILKKLNFPIDVKIIALLPGSRKAEIEKLLLIMLDLINKFDCEKDKIRFIIPIASAVKEKVEEIRVESKFVGYLNGQARELLYVADAAVVASGTATVEAALAKIPFCIVYKVSGLTYLIGKILIKGVKFIGMPNLISKKEIVKEYIQDKCTSEAIAQELKSLLYDNNYRSLVVENLVKVNEKLLTTSDNTVSETVANEIQKVLNE